MTDHQGIREAVSDAYAHAVRSASSSCCGCQTKGVAAGFAGYDRSQLAELPSEAVEDAFGCGNPVALAELQEGDVVVDLGCGAGIDLLLAAQAVGPSGRVIGIDMTDEMLKRARANIAASGLHNIEVKKGIIEALPVNDQSADWVISNCVINLSPEKARVFSELSRVLRPGGRVSISDIVVESLSAKEIDRLTFPCSCIAGAITESAYVGGLQKAGLIDVAVRDKVVYSCEQVADIVQSDLLAAGTESERDTLEKLSRSLEGRVFSARIVARRPNG